MINFYRKKIVNAFQCGKTLNVFRVCHCCLSSGAVLNPASDWSEIDFGDIITETEY